MPSTQSRLELSRIRSQRGPFLTDIDPQAAVRGSRDPLGVQSIWARLGRHVVGNLTTVSTSVRDFTTVILGYYFAERVAVEAPADGDLAVFLRWEQLAAYARGGINKDWQFRGVERAKKNWTSSGRVRLSAEIGSQILSDQKTYGLWGLYSVPARSSGLLHGDPTRLTIASRELVERCYLPIVAKAGLRRGDGIVQRLARSRTDLDPKKPDDERLLRAVAKVLSPDLTSAEREVYRTHLLDGGPQDRTNGAQAILARAMESILNKGSPALSPQMIEHLAKRCRASGEGGGPVADRLERIRTAEFLLAPAAALFEHILASNGQTITEVAAAVKRHWGAGVRTINPEATDAVAVEFTGEADSERRWRDLARSLAAGDYSRAVPLLLEQNDSVMRERTGAGPWVDSSQGQLRVRFQDESRRGLPRGSELPTFWRHSYFIDSLGAIALALRS